MNLHLPQPPLYSCRLARGTSAITRSRRSARDRAGARVSRVDTALLFRDPAPREVAGSRPTAAAFAAAGLFKTFFTAPCLLGTGPEQSLRGLPFAFGTFALGKDAAGRLSPAVKKANPVAMRLTDLPRSWLAV